MALRDTDFDPLTEAIDADDYQSAMSGEIRYAVDAPDLKRS